MLKLSNLESIGKPVYKFQNNHSVDFDGVDDRIDLGEPISYTQHTISAWLKMPNSTPTKVIFDARDAADDGIRLRATGAEAIKYDLNNRELTSTNTFQDEWVHVVATYDGTTQKLYINGSLDKSAATEQEINTTTNARIGARSFTSASSFYEGKIDELAIYDRALEEEEVEKIYRIKYGANLVQNGNLDELGSELVTQPLNLSSNFQNNGGGIIVDNDTFTTAGGSLDGISSNSSFLVTGKTYKLIIAGNTTSSGFTIGNQVLSGNEYATGFGTHYFVASGDRLWIRQQTAGTTNITSFSIKQVDPNDRWTLNTGWSYGDSKAICDGSQTSTSNFVQSDTFDNDLTDTYKLSFDLVVTQGSVTASSGSMSQSFTTSGFKSFIGSPATGAGNLNFTAGTTFIGSVTNVMVEKQKYVATNLKLNSTPYSSSNLRNYYRMGDGILDTHPLICDMVEPSLGSELVVNGNFATDSDWSKQTGWSISNGSASYDGSGTGHQYILQSITTTSGGTYKINFDVLSSTGSNLNIVDFGSVRVNQTHLAVGNYTFYAQADASSENLVIYANGTDTYSIDNVSVKQVNGVPGLMTNMTEADITNDVPS